MRQRTLASWHQEERDICLILSLVRTGERVALIRISRKHQADPTLRLKDACDSLVILRGMPGHMNCVLHS